MPVFGHGCDISVNKRDYVQGFVLCLYAFLCVNVFVCIFHVWVSVYLHFCIHIFSITMPVFVCMSFCLSLHVCVLVSLYFFCCCCCCSKSNEGYFLHRYC